MQSVTMYKKEGQIKGSMQNLPINVISNRVKGISCWEMLFSINIVTSLAKEAMFLISLVCLFVCLFVCGQHYSKSYEWIGLNFMEGSWVGQ